jgi:peptide/nickel transport system permease protein
MANTLRLMVPAIVLSLLCAILLGVLAARRQHGLLDSLLGFMAFSGISVPVFWLGILAIMVFSVTLRWFPTGGMGSPGVDTVADALLHLVLPVSVLCVVYTGRWLRYVRSAMLDVLGQDYIRTARAKGLSESVVLWKHAFRNALLPLLTVVALSVPAMFSGAVLTETVFAWPGMGRLVFESVMNSDHYVAMVAFLISAAGVMMGNLTADALYVLADPRTRGPR